MFLLTTADAPHRSLFLHCEVAVRETKVTNLGERFAG